MEKLNESTNFQDESGILDFPMYHTPKHHLHSCRRTHKFSDSSYSSETEEDEEKPKKQLLKKPLEPKAKSSGMPMIIAFLCGLIIAVILAMIVYVYMPLSTIG